MVAVALALCLAAAPTAPWKPLQPGLELATFDGPLNLIGDHQIHVLRADPKYFELKLLNASADGLGPRVAKTWCAQTGCVAAINASMFKEGGQSVGLMRTRAHVNNPDVVKKYKAVLAFDPLKKGLPAAQLLDLERDDIGAAQKSWGTLLQNLRMVSHREVKWGVDHKHKWSTAAVGIDSQGRVLFIHSRSPYAVRELAEALLALPIDLQDCMYVEGGPEAQLYVNVGEEHEWVGSYETGFFESDDNHDAWPIPNVIALMPKH